MEMLRKSEALSNRKRDEELNDAEKLAQECAEDLEAFKKWTINDAALSETEKSAKKAEARPEVVVNRTSNLQICCTAFGYFFVATVFVFSISWMIGIF